MRVYILMQYSRLCISSLLSLGKLHVSPPYMGYL
uniref:Uncharacterized protein n=1 Tax=Anguilla anguilla TaxID=7936 RepID=A0A0E9UAE4_ANGAN